jgi:hypothetical protein
MLGVLAFKVKGSLGRVLSGLGLFRHVLIRMLGATVAGRAHVLEVVQAPLLEVRAGSFLLGSFWPGSVAAGGMGISGSGFTGA